MPYQTKRTVCSVKVPMGTRNPEGITYKSYQLCDRHFCLHEIGLFAKFLQKCLYTANLCSESAVEVQGNDCTRSAGKPLHSIAGNNCNYCSNLNVFLFTAE